MNDQVGRWIRRINEFGITKWILNLSEYQTFQKRVCNHLGYLGEIKADLLREKEGPGLRILRLWFLAHDGFTPEAESFMAEKSVL